MSAPEIAAQLIGAMEAAADREAGASTALVSVEITMLASAEAGAVAVQLTRRTRTLVFLNASFASDAGEPIAAATSVHKVLA